MKRSEREALHLDAEAADKEAHARHCRASSAGMTRRQQQPRAAKELLERADILERRAKQCRQEAQRLRDGIPSKSASEKSALASAKLTKKSRT
jgi:hypothetical protein